jgi:hypothetical protein
MHDHCVRKFRWCFARGIAYGEMHQRSVLQAFNEEVELVRQTDPGIERARVEYKFRRLPKLLPRVYNCTPFLAYLRGVQNIVSTDMPFLQIHQHLDE